MPFIRIIHQPPEVDPELAKALVGLVVETRSSKRPSVILPAGLLPKNFYVVNNIDLVKALTNKLGIRESTQFFLQTGKVTSIPKHCCKIVLGQ